VTAPASTTALQFVQLLAQFIHLLFRELMIALGLLQGLHHTFHIAQNGFQRMPNAINLSAQVAIDITFAAVTIVGPSATITSPAITAIRRRSTAPPVVIPTPRRGTFNVTTRRRQIIRLAFALNFGTIFHVIIRRRLRSAFAFGQRINFLSMRVFPLGLIISARRLAIVIFLAQIRIARRRRFITRRRIEFPTRATARRRWATASSTATTASAIAIITISTAGSCRAR
jgi:hypothetical protein